MANESLIRQYNKYTSQGVNLVKKALDSSIGVAGALIPEKLEQVITNTVMYLSPELNLIETEFDNQKTHDFNRLVSLPKRGGAMGENAVTIRSRGKYARDNVQLKIVRRKGGVTNFLADASKKYLDVASTEMENHLYAHSLDLSFYLMWGNANANPLEFSGYDTLISTNRINKARGGEVPTDLKFLDDLIDRNTRKQGIRHKKAFLMSPEMLSKVSSLLTNVRLNQGLTPNGLTQVDFGVGWRANAYRDIPIIESTAVAPVEAMGAVAGSTATTGGTIPDGQYHFVVAPVTYNGEQLASADVSVTASGGGTSTITLSFSPHENVDGNGAILYKVYAGTANNNHKLVSIVSAFTYDSDGTITGDVTSIVFTANPLVADSSVPDHMKNDIPMVATGGIAPEFVYLIDLDKYQGLGKFVYTNTAGSKMNGLVTVKPLAETDDYIEFLIKTYGCLVPSYEGSSSMIRGLRRE